MFVIIISLIYGMLGIWLIVRYAMKQREKLLKWAKNKEFNYSFIAAFKRWKQNTQNKISQPEQMQQIENV